jgi:glycosyltransferase involved in cell wall biosynthesis
MRGGEAVLEALIEMYPRAELFTLLDVPGTTSATIASIPHHTSFLQSIPGIARRYRHFLPLMPAAIERLDLSSFDLVISSSHCVAKGVRKARGAVHVSYVHAPMRYVWDRFEDYFGPGRSSPAVRAAAWAARPWLQRWDRRVSQAPRVDALVANSRFIAARVREAYGREATVVHPFAALERFGRPRAPEDFYLIVGAFAPYKRIDLAIEAFRGLGLPLKIAGGGQDAERLRRGAPPNVEFLGAVSDAEVADLYSRCRALVFPALEDFGITPLEAMAAGAPVIAFGHGGATETVTSKTGILFGEQTPRSLKAAIEALERDPGQFAEAACRARAAEFSRARFKRELATVIESAWRSRQDQLGS